MAALYPSNLPAPLKAGKSRKQAPAFRATEPYRGRVYIQPIGTETPVVWDLTFRFTRDQAQAFVLWFKNVLGDGVEKFNMQIKTEFGFVTHEFQFLPDGLLDCSEDGPMFTYKASAMARKLNIPSQYLDGAESIINGQGLRSIVVDTNNICF